jgi:DNA repair protein RAD50
LYFILFFSKLILGHNGAGKTTIIECLRLMTTGVFPPNSDNGKSFVLDPKIKESVSVTGCKNLILFSLKKKFNQI